MRVIHGHHRFEIQKTENNKTKLNRKRKPLSIDVGPDFARGSAWLKDILGSYARWNIPLDLHLYAFMVSLESLGTAA